MAFEYEPAEQGMQDELCGLGWEVPAGHAYATVAPDDATKKPAGLAEQLVAAVLPLKEPALQAKHADWPWAL